MTFGLPEFIAAEEMDRHRGYWWAPDGSALLVARVDETPVTRWHIADPAHPERVPAEVAYPAAGTPNADVTLLLARLDGETVPVARPTPAAFPYLVTAGWQDGHDPLVVVQSRDQRAMRILGVDVASGQTRVLHEDTDPVWLEIVPGVPAWTADGRIVWTRDEPDTRRLVLLAPGRSPEVVTPPGLQVRGVLDVDGDTVLFQASGHDPAEVGLWSYGPSGLQPRRGGRRCRSGHPRGRHDGHLPPGAGRRRRDRPRVPVRFRGPAVDDRVAGRTAGAARAAPGAVPGRAARDPDRGAVPVLAPGRAGRAGCRCCSTRTAARTRSGCSGRAAPTWSRSGSPSRVSRW